MRCVVCQEIIRSKGNYKRAKYCSNECRKTYYHKKWKEINPAKGNGNLNTGVVGAIGELRVSVDLLQKGCSVFRAVSSSAPCDLLVLRGTDFYHVEVRTGYKTSAGKIGFTKNKIPSPLKLLWAIVLPEEIAYFTDNLESHTWKI